MASFSKKVKIRHAGFTYSKQHEVMSPSGEVQNVWNRVHAFRGETVTLEVEQDYKLGLAEGAFWTSDYDPETGVPKDLEPEGEEADEFEEDEVEVDSASDAELEAFVKDNTIAVVLELADTPERAQRLLDAENRSTGNDPRKTLEAEIQRRLEEWKA